ncbi:MAG: hypothetical protein CMM50_10775, partial [Rhodospirillaceae bacterium]|nr:hypothetical protein [Rhodospirillaceae bacterium]
MSAGDGGAAILLHAAGQSSIELPADFDLLGADFVRQGSDLLLVAEDGQQILIEGYFDSAPAALVQAGGIEVSGHVVASFAGPLAPGQLAQAGDVALGGEPIGTVDSVTGQVTAQRVDGTVVTLTVGDPVFQGDVLETTADGEITLIFLDNSEFSMSESARMVLDELIYDPDSGDGSAQFSVLQGVFAFVSGEVAANNPGATTIETPVATIGIRGTSLVFSYFADAGLTAALVPDADGTYGEADITGPSWNVSLSESVNSVSATEGGQPTAQSLSVADAVSRIGAIGARLFQQAQATASAYQEASAGDDGSGGEDDGEAGEESEEGAEDGADAEEGGADEGDGGDGGDAELPPGYGDGGGEGEGGGETPPATMPPETTPPQSTTGSGGSGPSTPTATEPTDDTPFFEPPAEDTIPPTIFETGKSGDDTLIGDEGDDSLDGAGGNDLVEGAAGNDVLVGGTGNDTLLGQEGSDTLHGSGNEDSLLGGVGNDVLFGEGGDDTLLGGAGNDNLIGSAGTDTASFAGSSAPVTVDLAAGTATGQGNDTISSVENVLGSDGNDSIAGSLEENLLEGAAGNDTLLGAAGDDTLDGGAGNDSMVGGDDTDTASFAGLSAPVTVDLAAGTATGQGTDSLEEIENVLGSSGDDSIAGDEGGNVLAGAAGNDTLDGADGDDILLGGAGDDSALGGDGADVLVGGASVSGLTALFGPTVIAGTEPATVAVFDNPSFVDTSNTSSSESDTIQASLTSLGHTVTTFTGITAAEIEAALSGVGALVIPEQEAGDIAGALDSAAEAAIADFVSSGGLLVIASNPITFLNSIFGFSLSFGSGVNATLNTAEVAGTIFADGPTTLPSENATVGLSIASLPSGAIPVYAASGSATVTAIPFGAGQIVTLGWDWFNGAPLGVTDDGWLEVLDRAMTFASADGDDTLAGGAGTDTLSGGSGDDVLDGGDDSDLLLGGPGDGTLLGGAGDDGATGGSGDDSILGGDGSDFLEGEAGADTLIGGAGENFLFGGADNDVIIGDAAVDVIDGGTGDDSIAGGGEADVISAGDGDDTVFGEAGADVIAGGAGDDLIDGGDDNDAIEGNAGDDSLTGGDGADLLDGGDDNDELIGGGDADTLIGAAGDDDLFGGSGDDSLLGGDGADSAVGSDGADLLDGSAGNDTLDGGADADTLLGGLGDDDLLGGAGDDSLEGGSGADDLLGADGADTLIGGIGADSLVGGDGDDVLIGGTESSIGGDSFTITAADFSPITIGGTVFSLGAAAFPTSVVRIAGGPASEFGGVSDTDALTGPDIDTGAFNLDLGQIYELTFSVPIVNGDGDDLYFTDSRFSFDSLNFSFDGGSTFHTINSTDFLDTGVDSAIRGSGLTFDLFAATIDLSDFGVASGATFTSIQIQGVSGSDPIVVGNLSTGSPFSDTLEGGAGNDLLLGSDSDDLLDGGDDDDTLEGGAGDDSLIGGAGVDSLLGGDGDDSLEVGDDGGEFADGGAGDDSLIGGGAADSLLGGDDADLLLGGAGADTLEGGGGNDLLVGEAGEDSMLGGDGDDSLIGGDSEFGPAVTIDGGDFLDGGAGDDLLVAGSDLDTIQGGDGADTVLLGDAPGAAVDGGDGEDLVILDGDGESFSLAALSLVNVEFLDIDGLGNNSLFVDAASVLAATDADNLLVIDGSAGDSVEFDGFLSDTELDSVIGGETFRAFVRGDATVLVNEAIAVSGEAVVVDLAGLDGTDGVLLGGTSSYDYIGSAVGGVTDVNGDGFADMIIGAPGDDSTASDAGRTYVVFGSATGFGSNVDLGTLSGGNGFTALGAAAGDESGFSVSGIGDVNDDGIQDLIVGAPYGAEAYVLFGTTSGFASSIDLSALSGADGFTITGFDPIDESGFSVSGGGDINGDGLADFVVGAPYVRGADYGGHSYVVFGSTDGFPSSLSLGSLDGFNGFAVHGAADFDRAGASVSLVGDLNGDGIDDLMVGAPYAAGVFGDSGVTYVVLGTTSGFSADIDLSSLDGDNGLVLRGFDIFSAGASVASAGDVNGDGFGDVIIGAPHAYGGGLSEAGQA